MRRVWLFKEDFGLFHQDITPQEYEFFRTHAGAFKRMWHEQVGHARVNIAAPSDLPRSFPSSLLSHTPSLSLSLLPLTLTHSPFFPPACDCRPSLSLQSRRFWSLFVNAFEHFIWNYGIMKDFPMKVQSRYQRIPGSWPSTTHAHSFIMYIPNSYGRGSKPVPSPKGNSSLISTSVSQNMALTYLCVSLCEMRK